MTFDECFDRLIGHEGAYDNNPKDRGNWTSGVIGKVWARRIATNLQEV